MECYGCYWITYHREALWSNFPVFLLALVYHNVVPFVSSKLNYDKERVTKSIVCGTAIPLVMFVLWDAVVLGSPAVSDTLALTDPAQTALGSLGPMVSTIMSFLVYLQSQLVWWVLFMVCLTFFKM